MSLKRLASRKFFKGIHIKILGLVVISAASLALVIVISAVLLRDMLIEDRKEKIRAAVEIATTSFDSLAQAVEKNEMTRDQALRQARDLIHTMRFDGKNYVFAFTRDGLSIGHGTNRAIEGANLLASANTALAGLTRRTIDAMTGNSQVFLFDHGPKGGTGADVPKIYFLKDQAALGFMVASVIEIDDINAAVTRQVTVLALAGGLVTVVTALIGGRIGWRIGRRIDRLAGKMKRLSDGDISVEFPEAQAGDQIGDMALAMEVFRQNAADRRHLHAERDAKAAAQASRQVAMERLARTFEADIGEIAHSVAQAAEEVETSSGAMRAAADVTGERAETVAAATHQASSNVQTVAAASQEMAASIQDIARKTQLVEDVSRKAITTASHSGGLMRGLDEAAREISDVVKLIEDIAGRTNLLALNATIEAARAGEAGKGFAVVASEVKALANQTAQATSRISTQVQSMQGAAASAVGAMSEIGKVIEEAAEVMGTITVAVEQQNVMTREIVRNVTEAAAGTDLVSRSITEVSRHARQTSGGAGEVQEVARRLGSQSIAISRKVTDFVGDLRAAS